MLAICIQRALCSKYLSPATTWRHGSVLKAGIIWRVTWDTTKHDSDLICFCCFCGIVRVENWKYYSRVLSAESHKQTWHTYYSENQSVNFKDEQTILPDRWIYTHAHTHNMNRAWAHTRLTTNRWQPTFRCAVHVMCATIIKFIKTSDVELEYRT